MCSVASSRERGLLGAGGNIQLEAIRARGAAGHSDLGLTSGGLEVVGQAGVAGRPVDKVDEVDGEDAGVGVDGVPGQGVLLALGDGGVELGRSELDGGNERRRESDERKGANHFCFVFYGS